MNRATRASGKDRASDASLSTRPVRPPATANAQAADLNAFAPLKSASSRRNPKRRRRIAIGVVLGIIVLLVAAAVLPGILFPEKQQIETVSVTQGSFENAVEGKASLEPVQTMVASAEVDGIVSEVKVSEGETVNEGDVLYVVKNDDLDAAVSQAQSALQSARDGVTQAQNRLNTARTTPSVNMTQDAEGNPVSVDTQAVQISDAQAQLNTAQASLTAAQESYDAAVAKAEKRTVRASISGTVVENNLSVGTSLSSLTSQGKAPMRVADMSKLLVKIPISEVDIAKIEVGQSATVTFDAFDDVTANAQVTHIAQTSMAAEAASGSQGSSSTAVRFEVTLQIDEPDARLKSGMTAHTRIITQTMDDVLLVPNVALLEDGDTAMIAKLPAGAEPVAENVEDVRVRVVAKNASQSVVEVVSGSLADGDTLAVIPAPEPVAGAASSGMELI